MADMAVIGIRSDTRDLKRGGRDLDTFARKGERTERRVKKSAAGMAGAMNLVSASAVRMAAVAGAALAGFMTGRLFLGAIREQEQLQTNMLKTQAIIEATGGAAQRTARQLHDNARALARATLQSTEGIMAAQQVMLTFRNVTGETFDRAIEAAADMSEALGTDLNSSVLQLGKALEDPVTGMTALSRSGTVFTQSQRDLAREMVRVGDTAGAQAFILGELEQQYGGVARAAATGLAGSMDTLGQSFQEFNIALADSMGLGSGASGAMAGLSASLDFMAENMDVLINSAMVATLWFGGKLVGAFALANIGAITLAGTMAVLKTALLYSGIGALIIGAGLLITWFGRLVENAGGFGAALGLLGDVAIGVWDDMKIAGQIMGESLFIVFNDIRVGWGAAMIEMRTLWAAFIEGVAIGLENVPFMGDAADALHASMNRQAGDIAGLIAANRGLAIESETALLNIQLLSGEVTNTGEALVALSDMTFDTAEEMEGGASAADELSDALDDVPVAAGGAAGALATVQTAAEQMAETLNGYVTSAVDGIANAFGDFVAGGLQDFKGFVRAVWDSFKNLLSQMIALAVKNKIMISLGLGGAGAGGAGGLLGGAMGSFAVAGGAAGSGLLGGLGAALGVGGATGGGILGIGASAAAAGGGILATVGAALPIIGIGLALFALFKKKPAISKEDFAAIQTGLDLTGMALFDTGRAGKKMAADLLKSFDSIEDFTKATQSYYDNFFTEEEKRQKAIEGIAGVFDELGMAVPATATAFREIVEAQDLTTAAGRDTYAALLQVSEAFAAVYGGVNDVTGALTALNNSVGGSIFSTLVDERRAAAYLKNGIAFDVADPDRAGGGIAYRGIGPRVVATPQTAADFAAAAQAEHNENQTKLLIDIYKNGKRTLSINDSWNVEGLPPERT